MKVFTSYGVALESTKDKESFFLNGRCPHSSTEILCGSWCALFYFDKGCENTSPYVILGCKAGEKYLYIEELVEG
jgi:hypothetical protein